MKYIAPAEARTQRLNMRYLDELRELCRKNRNNPTESEDKMWRRLLRSKRIKQNCCSPLFKGRCPKGEGV